jgi:hypothetical protein
VNLRLPSNWRTLGFTQKAAYLCSTRQARDYSEACSILGKCGGRKPRMKRKEIRLPYAD